MSKACLLFDNEANWESEPNTLNCLATRCIPDSKCPDCPVTNVNEVAEYTMYIEKEPKRFYKDNYSVKCTPKGWGPVETVSYSRACPTAVFSDTVQYNGVLGDTHTFDCENGEKYKVECSRDTSSGVYTWVEKSTCENIKVPVEETGGTEGTEGTEGTDGSTGFSIFSLKEASNNFGINKNTIQPEKTSILTWIKDNIILVVIVAIVILIAIIFVLIKTFASR